MKKTITTLFALICMINYTKAQTSIEIDIPQETINNLVNDTEKIADEFFAPAFKGFIYSMNNGWYHTAKVHKKFGFDITIGASASLVPTEDELFNIAAIGLSNSVSVSNGVTNTPTVAGNNSDNVPTAELTQTFSEDVTFDGRTESVEFSTNFELPGGVKDDLPLNAVPAPSIQFALGLPYKFEAILRLVPTVGSDDAEGSLLGIGLKKEITSIFGPLKKLPLHVSLLAAYTTMDVNYTFDEINEENISTINGGNAEFELRSYTIQAIASLNFPIINIYGGVGFNGGTTELNLNGEYIINYDDNIEGINTTATGRVTNPFSLSQNVSGINATLGARLSLGFFKIFGSYTLQEYNSINGGIAFSFR